MVIECVPDEETCTEPEEGKDFSACEPDRATSETVLTSKTGTAIPIIAAWWRNYHRDAESEIQIDENGAYKYIKQKDSPPSNEVELSTSIDADASSAFHIKISRNTLKRRIFECMKSKSSSSKKILEDIESGITSEDVEQAFNEKPTMERNAAFLWATFNNRVDLMEILLKLGADIHFYEPTEGFTALHISAFNDNVDSTHFLISCGADVNFTSENYTALEIACFYNSFNVAKVLLDNGAKVNTFRKIQNKEQIYYGTPLHSAVKANAVACVQLLLAEGANIKSSEIIKISEIGEISPLHIAAELGYLSCMKMLLESGANPNVIISDTRNTPLHLAADGGFHECLSLLLSKGAIADVKNGKGQTALHVAVFAQSLECVEVLLEQGGCDPNAEDNKNCTPLHSAFGAVLNSCEITELLINYGAKVNKQNMYGYTPLHLAVLNECTQCIEILINKGADVSVRTAGGNTALGIIVRKTPLALSILYKKLDSAITIHDPEISYSIDEVMKFDFRIFMQPDQYEEITFLKTVLEEGQKDIIEHPLCRAFLHVKWGKICKYYIARLLFYIALVLCLTGYIYTIFHHCYQVDGVSDATNVTYLCLQNTTFEKFHEDNAYTIKIQKNFLLFFIICEIIRKLCVLAGCSSVKDYMFSIHNAIEWFVLITSILVACLPIGKNGWQNQVAAFTILFAWINLMYLIGQLPILGSYITMYIKIQKEFLKLFMAYFCLLIGFTFSFCVILPTKSYFENPFFGFIKVVSMMVSSIDYKDFIFDTKYALIVTSAHIIFLSFILFGTIIMMNLLIGIAVHDIQGLRKTARLSRLVCQIQLITKIEVSLIRTWMPKCVLYVFRYLIFISPFDYRAVLQVKPMNRKETRLPQDILQDAYDLAKSKKHNSYMSHKHSFIGTKNNISKRKRKQQETSTSNQKMHKETEENENSAIAKLTREIQELKSLLKNMKQ